jgi:hypothetical protein
MAARLSKNGKPLGRPPKNKTTQTAIIKPLTLGKAVEELNKASTGIFVIDKQEEKEPADSLTEIECELLPIKSVSSVEGEGEKFGRYSGSIYSMSKFNLKGWVVISYLKADFEHYRKQKLSNEEILQKCVNYLNRIERKKYQKKEAAPKYGYLKVYDPSMVKFINKFGSEVASIELVTDDRKNENFWGEGERF